MTRPWASADECSRLTASVANATALSNPTVVAVPPRSLSMVFGATITRMPSAWKRAAMRRLPSPPKAIRPSAPSAR
jgi:hypothetical protein